MRARLVLREPGVEQPPLLPRLAHSAMTLDRKQGSIQVCIDNDESLRGHAGSVTAREAACCLIFDLPSAQSSPARCSS